MFLKVLSFVSLLFLIQCNKGKVEFEQCGCEDRGNRRQYLVKAQINENRLPDFFAAIVDLQSRGGGGNFEPLRIDGLCTSMETSQVVFCAEDRRDYEVLRDQFQDINFNETLID